MSLLLNKKTENYLPALIFALGFRVLLTLYWLARFGGYWLESDTSRTTASIQAVLNSGVIAPERQRVYSAGFLYQVYGTVLSLITGLSVQEVQHWIVPLVGILITLMAFTFYLNVFKNPTAAAISVTLLNLQGDFILTTMRSSHEKLDYLLIFGALLVLALSVKWFDSLRERLALAVVYYLFILAENTSNVFFASTFTAMLILSFLLWNILAYFTQRKYPGTAWLLYVAIISTVFTFVMVFVWYPPARSLVLVAGNLADRIRLFLFSPVEAPTGALDLANSSWVLPNSWLWLRIFDIFLLATAGVGWLHLVAQMHPGAAAGSKSSKIDDYFWLIILLPGFAFQNFVLIFSDLTGSVGQINNLQIRMIPLTVFVAAPISTYALLRLLGWLRSKNAFYRGGIVFLLFTLLLTFLITGVIKGASEPMLSNIWLFYTPAEYMGVRWLNQYIPLVTQDSLPHLPLLLADREGRIGRLWLDQFWGPKPDFLPVVYKQSDPYNYLFISPAVRISNDRFHLPAPDLRLGSLIYTNGPVEIYFYSPEGP